MIQSKIIKFGNIQRESFLLFEQCVNQRLSNIERDGGYIMNVRFDKSYDSGSGTSDIPSGDYFYAFILFNTERRNGSQSEKNHD